MRVVSRPRFSQYGKRALQGKKISGFTLIEILLTVVLFSMLAALSIPNLSKQYARLQVDQAASRLGYLARWAQSAAIIHQKEYRLCFDREAKSYALEEEDDSAPAQKNILLRLQRLFVLVSGEKGRKITLAPSLDWDASNVCAYFYPDGTMDRFAVGVIHSGGYRRTVSTQEQRGKVSVLSSP